MPFYDRNDEATGSYYRVHAGWKNTSIGSIQTTTTLNQSGTDPIKGFVIHTQHEILSGADQAFGLRLFENGSAITSYGSARRADGTVVSSKATDHIQGATNTTSNSMFDVVSGTIKVYSINTPFSGTGGWVVAEVMNFNDNVNFDKYYYKFQISDTSSFDYNIYWDWIGSSDISMSGGNKDVWYTTDNYMFPGVH